MKKIIILMLCFLLTGCTVVRIDTTNVDNIVKVVLSKENNLYLCNFSRNAQKL